MKPMSEPDVVHAFSKVLNELIDGSATEGACVLNREDTGLIGLLNRISAEKASSAPSNGGLLSRRMSSICAGC
jgi:hypothetical protein